MIKAAAYCRVSTEKDAQINSLVNQEQFFRQYIENQEDWELAEIYVDEGTSGTATKCRQGFLKMLADGREGRFQILLTKEISRFARNTLDSIYYTRKLKEWGIGVIFLNDNINTLDPDAELRLTIMASIAQEESRKTSERVKWGQKRQMEKGVVFGHGLLGYRLQQGNLLVEEEGAAIVRQIFEKFVTEQKGSSVIARELTAAGIPTPGGGQIWSHNVVLKILKNRKYMGDLVQKKTYTPNYLTHQKKTNQGEEPFVVLEQHHPPIISPELFAAAEKLLAERGQRQKEGTRYSHSYCFSGKLLCAQCGNHFVARSKKKAGKTYLYWQCYGKVKGKHTCCASPTLAQGHLERILLALMKELWLVLQTEQVWEKSMTVFFSKMDQVLGQAANRNRQRENLEKTLRKLEQEQSRLLHLYLQEHLTEKDFCRENGIYQEKITQVKEKLASASLPEKAADRLRAGKIIAHCESLLTGEIFSESFYRTLLEKIVIAEKTQMSIYLEKFPYEIRYEE